jgi:hypothetical protein
MRIARIDSTLLLFILILNLVKAKNGLMIFIKFIEKD